MAKRDTMDDQKLVSMVEAMKGSALGYQTDTLSVDRQDAFNHYFGRPYGNEIDGRSKVVERTLMEVVEWKMPQVMRAICTTDEIARFNPRGPDDVEQAQQETDYVNYLIMERNDGFQVMHDVAKDAMLCKNGYAKRWWEEYDDTHVESYTALDEVSLTQLMTDLEEAGAEVEVLSQNERQEVRPAIAPQPGVPNMAPQTGQTVAVFDVKLRVTETKGRVCVAAVPAEEMLISPRCRGDLQASDFVGHIPQNMTRADLIEMGMDKDFVDALPSKGIAHTKPDEIARDTLDQTSTSTYSPNNESQDVIDYLEAYVLVDYDGDGKAERRRIVLAGGRLPPGDQWNEEVDEVPFSYGTFTRMPHRHVGLGEDDFVADIQLIRTTLSRQMLDNTYIINNQRPVVNDNVVLSDVALSAPGAPIRVKGKDAVQGAFQYAPATTIIDKVQPVLEYYEERTERRTGIGRNNTIIDSDVLRDSANKTVQLGFNAANQRLEMGLRLFAEMFLKDLVRGVHGLVIKHQNYAEEVRLRGKWAQIDPREWRERHDLSVTVGLGIGTTEERRQNLMFMGTVQQAANAAGIVSPKNAYNLAQDIYTQTGFKEPDRYFTDPDSPAGKEMAAQKAQAAQAQQQLPLLIEQIKAKSKADADQLKYQLEGQRMLLDHQLKTKQITTEQHAQALADLAQQQAEAQRNALDHQGKQDEIVLKAIVDVVVAALRGKADAAQIPADITAARGALNG